ncbi:MAG TPA: winged helix-turn-helix domain-containing protein [Stellaceae bacterium]|nr:winged helix-turn-helix domain-containing protein [Stellaceae bacterium]
MGPASEASAGVAFGRFRVFPHRRELLADGRPVKLGGRAFDVLMALIEARGAVLGKDALMARVWPDRVVEENNLQSQIVALRRVFGAERELIRTVSGRGYQFTGDARILRQLADDHVRAALVPAQLGSTLPLTNLPHAVSALIGRDEELGEILNLAAAHRLVTLTGAGGIGKTRLALALARELLPHFADGVWVAELSSLADPGLVPATVAAAVGLELGGREASPQRVAQALAAKRLLVVFDTCEHVIAAASALAEAVLRAGSAACIIATSRESLRAEGEWIYPLPPLTVPAEDPAEADDPQRYAAVRLFLDRARAAEPRFAPDRHAISTIAAICRRLDGIPLAIELAAARAAALGIEELAARLGDRFRLLTGGRRTALPRHQTLRATHDWSYELLLEPERVILRHLAVFAGAFSLEAAGAIAPGADFSQSEVVDSLSSLIAKSLVAAETGTTIARYRLLDTTRAYALEKLAESGKANAIWRRHAEYYRDLLQAAADDKAAIDDWPAVYAAEIDNIRAALAWAFGSGGDASIGVALAAASVPIWLETSLLGECRGWMEAAIAGLDDAAALATRDEMVLQCAFGYSLVDTQGWSDKARAALLRASELADSFQDIDYQVRTLAGLAILCTRAEDYQAALTLGRRAEAIIAGSVDPIAVSIADWMLGVALHLLGDYAEALAHAQRATDTTAASFVRRSHIVRLGRDSFILSRGTVALILWAQGLPDQSAQTAREALADAEVGESSLSRCLALTWCGCVVSLWLGDIETAERSTALLKDLAGKYDLSSYYAYSLCFEGQLSARRGDVADAERMLRAGLAGLRRAQSEGHYTAFLGDLAEILMMSGQLGESLAAADEALQRTERSNALWWMPEALRIKGEVLLVCNGDGGAAEDHFLRSLDLAHRQGALSWELRAAASLARLLRSQGRSADAIALLQPVYDRFTEGFETADLKAAKALLGALR